MKNAAAVSRNEQSIWAVIADYYPSITSLNPEELSFLMAASADEMHNWLTLKESAKDCNLSTENALHKAGVGCERCGNAATHVEESWDSCPTDLGDEKRYFDVYLCDDCT